MIKFVLDADGTIKLAKAGVLGTLAANSKCVLSRRVYEEILKGKEKMYQDAFDVEALAKSRKIKVENVAEAEAQENLGEGEISALAAFRKHKGNAVISDDAKFLSVLEKENIPFIIPTDVIVWLFDSKRITQKDASRALDAITGIVRKKAYQNAKKAIMGDEK